MLTDKWIEYNCVSFSPSGQHVVVGDSMGQMLSWKFSDLKVISLSSTVSRSGSLDDSGSTGEGSVAVQFTNGLLVL